MPRSATVPRRVRNGFFDMIAPFWDAIAGSWGLGPVLSRLELGADSRLLDLAGGSGRLAARLSSAAGQVVLADLSGPMARRARRRDLAALCARAEALPFPDASFDRLLVVDAFHHMAHLSAAAEEISRVLRPGGLAVLFEPDPATWPGALVARLERWAGFGSLLLAGDALAGLFRDVGLEVTVERLRAHLLLTAVRPAGSAGMPPVEHAPWGSAAREPPPSDALPRP